MSLTPLKVEIDAISKLLMEGAESPAELAKSVIKELDRVRAQRVTYSLVLRFGSKSNCFFQAYGPYATKNKALAAYQKHPAAGMATAMAVVPQCNDEGLDELIAKVDAPPKDSKNWLVVADDARAFKNGWNGKNATREKYLS